PIAAIRFRLLPARRGPPWKSVSLALSAVSSRCMIYRTSRVVTTRLTTSKIICRYGGRAGAHAAAAPENDRDRRSLASLVSRCPRFSRHRDWPSLDPTWRRGCVVAGGGSCLRLERRQGAACERRGSHRGTSTPEAIGTTRMRVTENVRGSASLARRRRRLA